MRHPRRDIPFQDTGLILLDSDLSDLLIVFPNPPQRLESIQQTTRNLPSSEDEISDTDLKNPIQRLLLTEKLDLPPHLFPKLRCPFVLLGGTGVLISLPPRLSLVSQFEEDVVCSQPKRPIGIQKLSQESPKYEETPLLPEFTRKAPQWPTFLSDLASSVWTAVSSSPPFLGPVERYHPLVYPTESKQQSQTQPTTFCATPSQPIIIPHREKQESAFLSPPVRAARRARLETMTRMQQSGLTLWQRAVDGVEKNEP
ncbi:hypothetical protein K469DRAFT_693988 [Zopfia rhizophila CBS 207.26]|uniref:Uncharacterized protein n=1 Tax=Zopfia rhizophila CBS 207.26 TaxID=1314779 RepID=A0A6A6DM22_9PEZI|nr:hypothetical protein K469DRAFT_693988 [Zopfia rhizophila CBS 207.26]